jgi:hypothetical protein
VREMTQLAYSSTEAFIAHLRIMSNAGSGGSGSYPLSAQDQETLKTMHQLLGSLSPEERAILLDDTASTDGKGASGKDRRRRERAQHKLHRLLLSKGVLRG